MKKLITALSIFALLLSNVHAYQNPLGSTEEHFKAPGYNGVFREDTQYDLNIKDIQKHRTDKNASFDPPVMGAYGGKIQTEFSSPYFDNEPHRTNYIEVPKSKFGTTSLAPPKQDSGVKEPGALTPNTTLLTENKTYGFSLQNQAVVTSITPDKDNVIGSLEIPSLNYNLKVFGDAKFDTMKKGVGLIEGTSAWSGNVGLAGHNRGSGITIGKINKLQLGDTITYTTHLGKKMYKVAESKVVDVNDTSVLNYSNHNQLTLITCIANKPNDRLCITALESEE